MSGQKNRSYVDIMATHPGVTGSCILCVVKECGGKTIKFAVDCGLFQGQEHSEFNKSLPFNTEELDFMLLTHNHVDHTGRIAFAVKHGFSKPIYMTKTTSRIIHPALKDSCKVLRDLAKRNNEKPLYEEKDIEIAMPLIRQCDFNETIEVLPNVKVTFFINGHLLGSALILVQISSEQSEDINLLFTGDYNNKNMFFDVPDLPQWVLDLPLTIIQESTYGDMDSNEIKPCFESNILEAVHERKTIVVPVFSLGRSQEISYILKNLQDSNDLDVNIPIYLDGSLTQEYTRIFLEEDVGIKESAKDFLPRNLTYINKGNRWDVVEDTDCKIILTSSGMGSYGPAQVHIPEVISRKNGLIHFTGYTAEGTLGRRLQETEYRATVSVGGLVVRKFGDVKYTKEFSAHAKADEMIAFLKKFNHLKLVLINHGEPEVKETFATRVLDSVETKNVGVLGRDYLFRINPYGLVKTMGTKFC